MEGDEIATVPSQKGDCQHLGLVLAYYDRHRAEVKHAFDPGWPGSLPYGLWVYKIEDADELNCCPYCGDSAAVIGPVGCDHRLYCLT